MTTPEKDGPVQPVLIFSEEDELVSCALINDKGRAKSLEQGELWTLDGSTGRLLPWAGGGSLIGLAEEGGWVSASVRGSSGAAAKAGEIVKELGGDPAERGPETEGSGEIERVLVQLEELIRSRKQTMPEGSYTTHLFAKGEEKIRKKTGEEAIELVLARSDQEIVSESADLVYHLMVLLAARDIPLKRIVEELSRR